MINKIILNKKSFLLKTVTAIFLALFSTNLAIAADNDGLDIEFENGNNVNGNKILGENNIYPGWDTSKTIKVSNDSEEDTTLYIKFKIDDGKTLAKVLKIYVVRVADHSYRIGGSGDRYTLKEADRENLYLDKLSAGESEKYRIKVLFDKNAGNEYQGKNTKFDIDFEITAEDADEDEEEILENQGRSNFTGNTPEEESVTVEGETDTTPEIQKESANTENPNNDEKQTTVAGESDENVCKSLPNFIWVLLFLAQTFLIAKKGISSDNNLNWKLTSSSTAASIIAWYFLDGCRTSYWFWQGSIVINIILQFVLLEIIKKRNKG